MDLLNKGFIDAYDLQAYFRDFEFLNYVGIIHYFNSTDDLAEAIDDKLSFDTL